MARKFATDRHSPEGKWVIATQTESVVGIQYRKSNAKAFAGAASKAEKKGLLYGLQLEHLPNHPKDRNAIAVFGVADTRGLFRSGVREWHIGFVPAELAAELCEEFVRKGVPIAAELYSIYEGDTGFLDFKFLVLAPPGNSVSSRSKRGRHA